MTSSVQWHLVKICPKGSWNNVLLTHHEFLLNICGTLLTTNLKKFCRFCRFLQISTTLRTITYSSYTTPAVPLSKKLHLLNTHQINDVLIASSSFSLNNNVLLPYFDEFCIENLTMHSYNTRESKQLHMIFNRQTNYGKYCTRER